MTLNYLNEWFVCSLLALMTFCVDTKLNLSNISFRRSASATFLLNGVGDVMHQCYWSYIPLCVVYPPRSEQSAKQNSDWVPQIYQSRAVSSSFSSWATQGFTWPHQLVGFLCFFSSYRRSVNVSFNVHQHRTANDYGCRMDLDFRPTFLLIVFTIWVRVERYPPPITSAPT